MAIRIELYIMIIYGWRGLYKHLRWIRASHRPFSLRAQRAVALLMRFPDNGISAPSIDEYITDGLVINATVWREPNGGEKSISANAPPQSNFVRQLTGGRRDLLRR